jgi:hypothetical protein
MRRGVNVDYPLVVIKFDISITVTDCYCMREEEITLQVANSKLHNIHFIHDPPLPNRKITHKDKRTCASNLTFKPTTQPAVANLVNRLSLLVSRPRGVRRRAVSILTLSMIDLRKKYSAGGVGSAGKITMKSVSCEGEGL